jgi:ectoine hydroxylase-related dioxygenase (phytanoyl-CoA dioxygenase family)
VSAPVEPGDVIAFHFRTLHDAPGTEGSSTRRRVVSLRWLGDDATFALRPWLHSPPFEQRDLVEGGPLDDDRFPIVS